ncbi:MAG: pilus assembly FimT family protein [Thermocrinis sp.]|jgi:type IV fimbrial biogenesis protein FimT|uniref:pilus assembly FimT family protein n=1 Tax=Thermocrinis sp. TaxID=2024383 RepID=UPI003BFB479F
MDRKVRGITIMEVLVVMAIIAILASASILGLRNLVQRERLYSAMTQVANDLKEVQFRSMSSNMVWGVRFCANQSQYKIFAVNPANVSGVCPRDANTSCTSDATTQRLVQLPPGVSPEAGFYVLFDRRGYPLDWSCGIGAGNITLRNSYGSRTVIVDRVGRIRYE